MVDKETDICHGRLLPVCFIMVNIHIHCNVTFCLRVGGATYLCMQMYVRLACRLVIGSDLWFRCGLWKKKQICVWLIIYCENCFGVYPYSILFIYIYIAKEREKEREMTVKFVFGVYLCFIIYMHYICVYIHNSQSCTSLLQIMPRHKSGHILATMGRNHKLGLISNLYVKIMTWV